MNQNKEELTQTTSLNIHQYHKDYVKGLCYSEMSNTLISCGLDGFITLYNIEEYNKTQNIRANRDNILFEMKNSNSIYSIDCDETGRIIISSVYENILSGFDIRQKREIFNLRGHKDLIRNVKISKDGKLGVSSSHDKTVKVWDLFSHRVLKNFEFSNESIHSMTIDNSFNKILTGSKKGELSFIDLPSGNYFKIDSLGEDITSIGLNSKFDLLVSTSQSKLYEYVYFLFNFRI